MSERIRYADEPLGNLKIVPDFLPPPEDLIFKDEGVKVTIALSKRSVEFFKDQARKHNTQYQRMMHRLLDAYAEHHSRGSARSSRRARGQSPHVQVNSIHAVRIKYFQDTDTLYIEIRSAEVAETKDLDDNTLLDLDRNRDICDITIEHASERAEIPKFS